MKNTSIGIIVTLIIVATGAYFIGQSSNGLTQSNAPQAVNIIQPVQIKSTQDQAEKCDTDAKNYFETSWKSSETVSDLYTNNNLSYQNHFTESNDSCYVLVGDDFDDKDNPDGTYSQKINYSLVDIYKKDPSGNYLTIGSYAQSISALYPVNNRIDTCNLSGQQCFSLDAFMSLVNPYLGITQKR